MISEEILVENGMWIDDDAEREAFLDRVADWVELRVGELMDGAMTPGQTAAFMRLCDGDRDEVAAQIELAGDDWCHSELYLTLRENTGEPDGSDQLRLDFATAFFLEKNCPTYREMIGQAEREASDVLGFRRSRSLEDDHPYRRGGDDLLGDDATPIIIDPFGGDFV